MGAEDVEEYVRETGSYPYDERILPAGAKAEAQKLLIAMLSAWCRAMLPGYRVSVIPPSKPRGRPRRLGEYDRVQLLSEFTAMLRSLDTEDVDPYHFKLQRRESLQKRHQRIAGIVARMHAATTYDMYTVRPSGAPLDAIFCQRPLVPTVVDGIIRAATNRGAKITRTSLAYAYLAHHTGMTPGAVRGVLQRAQQEERGQTRAPRNSR